MSADTHPENGKPANGEPSSATAAGEGQEQPAAPEGQAETVQTGPKAYVDPSIAAEAKIAELEAELAERQDRYVRAVAEMDNLRKRTEREKADTAKYAVTNFARDMVAIADNLRRAIAAAVASAQSEEQDGALKALLDGVELTDQELQKALEKHGVKPIVAEGEIFDPHKHQAVMEQENTAVPAGTVLQVFQDGYQIEDRVLRPSMVVVAKGGAKPVRSTDANPNLGAAADPGPAANDANGGTDQSEDVQAKPEGAKSTGQQGSDGKPESA